MMVTMPEVDMALRAAFEPLFGAIAGAQAVASTENASPRLRSAKSAGLVVALIDGIHSGAWRTLAAQFDHGEHRLLRPGEHRLDRTVAAVAHPAFETALARHRLRPGAETYALHTAANDEPESYVHPNSLSLREPAPRGWAGNQRRNDAMYAAGKSHVRAAPKTSSI